MGLFSFLRQPDINQLVQTCRATEGALLVDVRTPEEYSQGHIPGSINVPLQSIGDIEKHAAQKQTPMFVYCRSGARSSQAAGILKRAGYTGVTNIGGIVSWTGEVEK